MSQEEFSFLLLKEYPKLKNYALRFTNYDEVNADDLTSETIYKALKRKESFLYNHKRSMNGWLRKIMKNTYINFYNQRKKTQIIPLTFEISGHICYNIGEENLKTSDVLRYVHELKGWRQKPFLLHYDGYSYAEIAEKLFLPKSMVQAQVRHAKKQLRERLKNLQ